MDAMQETQSSLAIVPVGVSKPAVGRMGPAHLREQLLPGGSHLQRQHSGTSYSAAHFKSVTQTYIARLDWFFLPFSLLCFSGGEKKIIKPQLTRSGRARRVAQNAVKSHKRFDRSQYQLLSYNSFCDSANRILILCLLFGD